MTKMKNNCLVCKEDFKTSDPEYDLYCSIKCANEAEWKMFEELDRSLRRSEECSNCRGGGCLYCETHRFL